MPFRFNCHFSEMGYLDRIKAWREGVNTACGQVEAAETLDQFEKNHSNLFAETTDLGSDIELGFRGSLANYLRSPTADVNRNTIFLPLMAFS